MAEEVETSLSKEQAVKEAEVAKPDIVDGGSIVIPTTGKGILGELEGLMKQHGQDARIGALPPTSKEAQKTIVDATTRAVRRVRRNMGRIAPPIYK